MFIILLEGKYALRRICKRREQILQDTGFWRLMTLIG